MAINIQRLSLRFQTATGCSESRAQQLTQKYIRSCALAMLRDHFSQDAGSKYYINATEIQNTLNTVMVKGQRHYVWKTFQSFPERVFDVQKTGSNLNKEYTMAESKYTLEEVLLASGTPEELVQEVYAPFQADIAREDFDVVPIDRSSLKNYILNNLDCDRERATSALCEEWDRNLKHAQKIWMLAEAQGGELRQIRTHSAFGRRYYRGPNLQNTPKIVRHAALGSCHEYDIESSVFAWKMSWIKQICGHMGEAPMSMPATLEYLDHKRALRRRLAHTVFDTDADWAVQVIKEFITAIGFGSPVRAQGYQVEGRYQRPALATIITAKARLDRALADPWVQEFSREQAEMTAVITDLAQITLRDELAQVPELWEQGQRRIRKNSVVAWLYQHAEREILDWIEEFCADQEVLLTVHDCIYTRRPVDLRELRAGIRAHGEFFDVAHEQHRAWTRVSEEERDHRQRIQQEEREAAEFFGTHTAPARRRGVPTSLCLQPETWTGSGYTGTPDHYDRELDPFFDEENRT